MDIDITIRRYGFIPIFQANTLGFCRLIATERTRVHIVGTNNPVIIEVFDVIVHQTKRSCSCAVRLLSSSSNYSSRTIQVSNRDLL